jgi:hypothetical protein
MSIAALPNFRGMKKLAAASILATVLVLAIPFTTAHAAAVSSVTGNGRAITLTGIPCATARHSIITFHATKAEGKVTGSGTFSEFLEGENFIKHFVFSRGHSNRHHYRLEGILTAGSFACGHLVTGTVTVSGNCGVGVIIHYRDTAGEKADLKGNVVCT